MKYPPFTVHLRATNSGNLRNFSYRWNFVFSKRKKKAIIDAQSHEFKRYAKYRGFWF